MMHSCLATIALLVKEGEGVDVSDTRTHLLCPVANSHYDAIGLRRTVGAVAKLEIPRSLVFIRELLRQEAVMMNFKGSRAGRNNTL